MFIYSVEWLFLKQKDIILSVGLNENFTEEKHKYIWKEVLCDFNPLSCISADTLPHHTVVFIFRDLGKPVWLPAAGSVWVVF